MKNSFLFTIVVRYVACMGLLVFVVGCTHNDTSPSAIDPYPNIPDATDQPINPSTPSQPTEQKPLPPEVPEGKSEYTLQQYQFFYPGNWQKSEHTNQANLEFRDQSGVLQGSIYCPEHDFDFDIEEHENPKYAQEYHRELISEYDMYTIIAEFGVLHDGKYTPPVPAVLIHLFQGENRAQKNTQQYEHSSCMMLFTSVEGFEDEILDLFNSIRIRSDIEEYERQHQLENYYDSIPISAWKIQQLGKFSFSFPAQWSIYADTIVNEASQIVGRVSCPLDTQKYPQWDFETETREFRKDGREFEAGIDRGTPQQPHKVYLTIVYVHPNIQQQKEDDRPSCTFTFQSSDDITHHIAYTLFSTIR